MLLSMQQNLMLQQVDVSDFCDHGIPKGLAQGGDLHEETHKF